MNLELRKDTRTDCNKIVTTEWRKSYLVSEPNYHTKKYIYIYIYIYMYMFRKFISIRNKKQILLNKAVYLALSVLVISKTVIYKLWYDYVEPKYGGKAKLC